jgi:hypothetical protein
MKTRIAIAIFALAIANFAWAQSLSNNTTNFPMIGLVRGQTLPGAPLLASFARSGSAAEAKASVSTCSKNFSVEDL